MGNNRGFTLVELIAVLSIMAVLTGVGVSMMGLIPRTQVNSCSEKIVTAIEKSRTNALSFKNSEVELYSDSDGVYINNYVYKGNNPATVETTKVGDAGVSIYYTLDNGEELELAGDKLMLGFNRSSGAFVYSKLNGTDQTKYCTLIIIRKGTTTRKLVLTQLTGKVSVE